MKLDFSNHLFRCSQLGQFMGELKPNLTAKQKETLVAYQEKQKTGKITEKQTITLGSLIEKRDAKPELSKTAINKLREIHMEVLYNRSEDISSKYLDKGIAVEEQSKDLDSKIRRLLITDHPPRQNNSFITGQADAINGEIVIDYKSSWTRKTFPLYDNKVPTIAYYWQLQGYMWLYGKQDAELVYCLIDTPAEQVNDELRRLNWKHGISIDMDFVSPEHIPLIVETVTNHIYTSEGLIEYCAQSTMVELDWFEKSFVPVPDPLRHRVFKIERDEKAIEAIKTHVKMARKELMNLTETIAERLT